MIDDTVTIPRAEYRRLLAIERFVRDFCWLYGDVTVPEVKNPYPCDDPRAKEWAQVGRERW